MMSHDDWHVSWQKVAIFGMFPYILVWFLLKWKIPNIGSIRGLVEKGSKIFFPPKYVSIKCMQNLL